MYQKTVSVIIPMYNSAETIERALDSVRRQTKFEYIKEIIVVDDGSKDGSWNIVSAYQKANPNMPVDLYIKVNGGAASARNYGMRKATGKYIAFLDSDDLWISNKLERQLTVIKQNPNIRFMGTAWTDKPLKIGCKKITKLYNGSVKDICIKNFPVTPSVLMERALLDEIGYFDEKRRYAEDINYFQKFAAIGNFYFLPERLVQIDMSKSFFGQTGLTSHLKEMHQGTLINIKELKDDGHISGIFWLIMRVFYELKYWRRIIKKNIFLLKQKKGMTN